VDELTATPLAQIVETPIRWLCKPFLPRGKIVLLDGDPGLRKAVASSGIPERTLLRTKSDLGVLSHQLIEKGKQGVCAWWLYDPAVPWPKDAPFRRPMDAFAPLPPLDEL
jgi:hypothetical protein